MPARFRCRAAALLACAATAAALENGLARTPPCGLNSYMSGKSGAAFLTSIDRKSVV